MATLARRPFGDGFVHGAFAGPALTTLAEHVDLFACPGCEAPLAFEASSLRCSGCGHVFPIDDDVPQLFWPNDDWDAGKRDVTEQVRAFYEETPFPNYDEFDSVASLAAKARQGLFARLLDEQVPPGTRIIECGTGTGQLSSFLSLANRTVFATDLCMNSLRLGRDFARRHQLARVHFVQMNLFRPAFRPGSFPLVISNGVLHHTSDPFLAFRRSAGSWRPAATCWSGSITATGGSSPTCGASSSSSPATASSPSTRTCAAAGRAPRRSRPGSRISTSTRTSRSTRSARRCAGSTRSTSSS